MNHKQAIEGIRNLVTLAGGKCWVLSQSGRLYGSAGIPDCWCVMKNGLKFWVEVKVGKDTQSPAQIEFQQWSEKNLQNGNAPVPVIVGTSVEVQKYIGL